MIPTAFPPALSAPPPARQTDSMRQAAEALETAFLAEMIKATGFGRPPEQFGGGVGENQFASFAADSYAQGLMRRGGLGLASAIETALRARAGDGQ